MVAAGKCGKLEAVTRADAFSDKGIERISVSHYSI
jgi:hypothetical protein